jgi:type II pantothenate kinase
MPCPPGTVGIDAGATLWKLIFQAAQLVKRVVPAGDLEELSGLLSEWDHNRIRVTGGGVSVIEAALNGKRVDRVPEFEAWARGAPLAAAQEGLELPERYLLVSLGTGTSVLRVDRGEVARVAGTAIGGGTLYGLGRLLTGAETYDEVATLASRGDRRKVDLLVGDIYPQGGIALHPELNAASFAKLRSRSPADLAHAVVGLVGENVGIICTIVAQAARIETIVYAGTTLHANPALQEILHRVALGLDHRAIFLREGAFCGALGAASAG